MREFAQRRAVTSSDCALNTSQQCDQSAVTVVVWQQTAGGADDDSLCASKASVTMMLSMIVHHSTVLATGGAYLLLVYAVAQWLALAIRPLGPEPVEVGVYLLALLVPYTLARFRVWWIVQSDYDDVLRQRQHQDALRA